MQNLPVSISISSYNDKVISVGILEGSLIRKLYGKQYNFTYCRLNINLYMKTSKG